MYRYLLEYIQSNFVSHLSQKEKDEKRAGIFALIGTVLFFAVLIGITIIGIRSSYAQIVPEATESIPTQPPLPVVLRSIEAPPEKDEIIELRTETTQTFKTSENTNTIRIFQSPIFEKVNDTWFRDEILSFMINDAHALTATTSSGKDTYLASSAKTTNYGSANWLYVQNAENMRTILSFTTPNLSDYSISSATIKLTAYDSIGGENSGGAYVNLHQLSQCSDWVETQATWNICKTGTNWGTAGGDYTAQPISYIVPNTTGYTVNTWKVYGDSTPNPLTLEWNTQYHFLMKVATESAAQDFMPYYSDESGTVAYRPYMEITYVAQPPTITSFTPEEGIVSTGITVSGTNFTDTATSGIWISGLELDSYVFISSTSVHGHIPAGASTALISVSMTGGSATSSAVFTVLDTTALQNETNTRLGYLIALFTIIAVFAIFDFMRRTYIKTTS